MIDFGLAKQYMNPYTGKHITCTSGHYLTGEGVMMMMAAVPVVTT